MTTTETQVTPEPQTEWQAVMAPLRDNPLWHPVRIAATEAIEADLIRMAGPDHGQGIGTSDINHQIFAVARHLDPGLRLWPLAYAKAIVAALETW
jgi:hypothetical protein